MPTPKIVKHRVRRPLRTEAAAQNQQQGTEARRPASPDCK